MIDRGEFKDAIDRIYQAVDGGFSGVNRRLDDLNGRTRQNEIDIAVIKTKAVAYGSVAATVVTFISNWLLK